MAATKSFKRMLIGLAGCALLILVTCGLLYCNRSAKLGVLNKDLKQKQDQLANSQEIARRLPIARQEYLDAQTRLSYLEQGVSSKVYVPTFLRQIEELGKKNHLTVVGIRPRPAEVKPIQVAKQGDAGKPADESKQVAKAKPPADPYDKLELDIEMSGKYWDMVRFLYAVTSFPKIVTVNDIQVLPTGQPCKSVSPPLSVKLSATAFILKEHVDTAPKDSKHANVVAAAREGDKG